MDFSGDETELSPNDEAQLRAVAAVLDHADSNISYLATMLQMVSRCLEEFFPQPVDTMVFARMLKALIESGLDREAVEAAASLTHDLIDSIRQAG